MSNLGRALTDQEPTLEDQREMLEQAEKLLQFWDTLESRPIHNDALPSDDSLGGYGTFIK